MPCDDSLERESWRRVLGLAALALRKAKRYKKAVADKSAESMHRVEFLESCNGPMHARFHAGYNTDGDWQEFKEHSPDFARIIEELIACTKTGMRTATPNSESFDWLAPMEKSIYALARALSDKDTISNTNLLLFITKIDDRLYAQIGQDRYCIEDAEARYFELLIDASKRHDYIRTTRPEVTRRGISPVIRSGYSRRSSGNYLLGSSRPLIRDRA